MNKIVKILITLVVFTTVIIYFVFVFNPSEEVVETDCQKLNRLLLEEAHSYFSNNLPTENGDAKYVKVSKLYTNDLAGEYNLENLTGDLSGNIYVAKGINNTYYYSSDISYGNCSVSDIYTPWSNWVDTLPKSLNQTAQVQTALFYNYGKRVQKYSDWSDWGLTVEELKEPELPEGVTVSNNEAAEKTQYSYRDGSFKWYKLTGGKEYYDDGKYFETLSESGYSKDNNSKKVSRTTDINPSKASLTSSLDGLDYDFITTTAKKTATPKYIYSKITSTTRCPLYKCYNLANIGQTTGMTYSGTGNHAISVSCYTPMYFNALYECRYGGSMLCWEKYGNNFCLSHSASFYGDCSVTTCGSGGNTTYGYTYRSYIATNSGMNDFTFESKPVYKKTYYNNGAEYNECQTQYASEESGNYTTDCLSNSNKTIISQTTYLKTDGTTTTEKTSAAYLSDSEFSALGSNGTGFSKTSSVIYDTNNIKYVEGSCPGGVSSSTCEQITVYKANIYIYKWYKTSTVEKIWYNDGEYDSKQPNGYQADTSSAKWGDWSEYSDEKVVALTTRQVKTQVLKRIRKSYIDVENLYLDEYLPLDEFESKVGKKISELTSDTTVLVKAKLMYRFRTLIR